MSFFNHLSRKRNVLVLLSLSSFFILIGRLIYAMRISVLIPMNSISPFFRRFWPFLLGEIKTMFEQFHKFFSLQHGFSSFFATLTPKIDYHSHIGYFRPISFVGSFYKLLGKVLVERFSSVMDKLISFN